jgi:type II secretion system protein N
MAQVTLQPSLLGLIVGHPWPLSFTANLYDGTLSGDVTADASGQTIHVTAQRLDLRLLPLPGMDKGGEVQGILSGEGEVQGQFADLFSLHGQVTLTVTDGALRAGTVSGFPLPPLSSVEAQLQGAVKNGLVDITDFTLRADNAEARLRGTLTLSTPLPMSMLNLQINAKALGTTSPPLTLLLSLLPSSPEVPGERRGSIRGSLAAPVLQ